MKINVFSRGDAICYSGMLSEPTVIISIHTPGDSKPIFADNNNIRDILYLEFKDVDTSDNDCMSTDDANKIVKFIKKYKDIASVMIHCDAGISRSAGIGAAISKFFNNDDSEFFNKKCPNMLCYRLVLNELMEEEA